ncbi:MAG: GIY-YIG nuclease family protein [Urechidicola sp.]|nr:GIY-YIG nuclease family protein [Urechidicola sp.]
MKTYYVYILKCSDSILYAGITNDVERRLDEHQRGLNKTCFTFKRRPLELIFYQDFNDVEQAIYFEKKIKKWSSKKKLALSNGDYDMLEILSECRNATHHKYNPEKKIRSRLRSTRQ